MMRFIGIDLAWGPKNPTGLCAIGEDGVVIDSGRVHGDDQLLAWTEPHLKGGALVAVDAPLVVPNVTGRRHCDQLVSRVFGHRHASTHSVNRGTPAFVDGGRAYALAVRSGLSTDPTFSRRESVRRMIEVYPHTAIVSLFELPTILTYKGKAGRSLAWRKSEIDKLIGFMESLDDAQPSALLGSSDHWLGLVSELRGTSTAAALDRAEDELDAYVCAYVAAYFWYWGDERCRVIGDAEGGYITTPLDDDALQRLDRLQ